MKFMRTIAMLLALILMSSCCAFAETTEDEGNDIQQAALLPAMELTFDEWISTPEVRAMFAVLFQLELGMYEETYPVSEYLETYGIPTIYLAEVPGDLAGDAITMYLFYEDTEGTVGTGMLLCATYLTSMGMFVGFTNENNLDPAVVMETFAADSELISTYYPVTFEEYYDALLAVEAVLNSEE